MKWPLRLILILCLFLLLGCYETKKESYSERRGLMLLEKNEYVRNKDAYKPSKKLDQIRKKIKRQQRKKRRS